MIIKENKWKRRQQKKKITSMIMKKNSWKNKIKKERKLSMIALGMMRKSKLEKWDKKRKIDKRIQTLDDKYYF